MLLADNSRKIYQKSPRNAINGFNNIKLAAENMALVPNDPVKAMMGQKVDDNEQMKRIYNAMNNLQEYF